MGALVATRVHGDGCASTGDIVNCLRHRLGGQVTRQGHVVARQFGRYGLVDDDDMRTKGESLRHGHALRFEVVRRLDQDIGFGDGRQSVAVCQSAREADEVG